MIRKMEMIKAIRYMEKELNEHRSDWVQAYRRRINTPYVNKKLEEWSAWSVKKIDREYQKHQVADVYNILKLAVERKNRMQDLGEMLGAK